MPSAPKLAPLSKPESGGRVDSVGGRVSLGGKPTSPTAGGRLGRVSPGGNPMVPARSQLCWRPCKPGRADSSISGSAAPPEASPETGPVEAAGAPTAQAGAAEEAEGPLDAVPLDAVPPRLTYTLDSMSSSLIGAALSTGFGRNRLGAGAVLAVPSTGSRCPSTPERASTSASGPCTLTGAADASVSRPGRLRLSLYTCLRNMLMMLRIVSRVSCCCSFACLTCEERSAMRRSTASRNTTWSCESAPAVA
mmetsp:Transcript_39073/g.78143  ORF Transcript_39073/g.78143 Transcript_39073/m.78143 type:complete len:250 (+) Transcript_39073:357-1106(+)